MQLRNILIASALWAGVAAAASDDRVIEGSAPVGATSRLTLDADVGSITVKAGADDTVRWRVALEADVDGGWFSSKRERRDVEAAIAAAKVEASVRGDALELLLDLPRGTDEDDIEQRWTIEVPAAFGARLALDVGDLKVSGIGGGVRASVDVGSIGLDLTRGAVEATVDVGSIDIVTAETTSGDIDLAADVGDVDLELDGRRIRNEHGYGPGESLRLTGKGGDRVRARIDVGSIDAIIGKR
jgi:hypothetical protein